MYTSKRISDKDYTTIQELYKDAFSVDVPLNVIKDKYNTELFGQKNVGLIASDNKQNPAAYYGVFPIILREKAHTHLIAQSGDTMTAPQHQKKGLFTRLAKEAYQLSAELGIKLVFGFPNKFSFPGFKHKLEWIFTGYMYRGTVESKVFPFCELSIKFPFLRKLYTNLIDKRAAKYTVSPEDVDYSEFIHPDSNLEILKDVNFLKYKLRNKQVYLLAKGGYTFLVKVDDHLRIGLTTKINEKDVSDFIKEVKALSKIFLSRRAVLTLSDNHWLYSYLKNKISFKKTLPIGYYLFDEAIKIDEIQYTLADFDTF